MKPKNEEREAAMKAGQLTYVDKNPHIDQKTKGTCGTYIRYARTGKCVACSRSGPRGKDCLAAAGERLMLRNIPKAERMDAAANAYVQHSISIMRCAFLFSLNNQDLGLELKQRGLTRARAGLEETAPAQYIDAQREKVFNKAMQAFAPSRRQSEITRG